jgi:hypothetical protein
MLAEQLGCLLVILRLNDELTISRAKLAVTVGLPSDLEFAHRAVGGGCFAFHMHMIGYSPMKVKPHLNRCSTIDSA